MQTKRQARARRRRGATTPRKAAMDQKPNSPSMFGARAVTLTITRPHPIFLCLFEPNRIGRLLSKRLKRSAHPYPLTSQRRPALVPIIPASARLFRYPPEQQAHPPASLALQMQRRLLRQFYMGEQNLQSNGPLQHNRSLFPVTTAAPRFRPPSYGRQGSQVTGLCLCLLPRIGL